MYGIRVRSRHTQTDSGAALLISWRHPRRALVGIAVAVLFVAVLPGNIAQLTELLTESWRLRAPASLVKQWDADHA